MPRPQPIKPADDTSHAKRFRDAVDNVALTPDVKKRIQTDVFDHVAREVAPIPFTDDPEKRAHKSAN